MPVKGKQIEDYTITQNKMNITTESIIDPEHVVNKEYVDGLIVTPPAEEDVTVEVDFYDGNMEMPGLVTEIPAIHDIITFDSLPNDLTPVFSSLSYDAADQAIVVTDTGGFGYFGVEFTGYIADGAIRSIRATMLFEQAETVLWISFNGFNQYLITDANQEYKVYTDPEALKVDELSIGVTDDGSHPIPAGTTFRIKQLEFLYAQPFALATTSPIKLRPRSKIRVNVNGLEVNVGVGAKYHAIWSPDGIIIRPNGDARIGDKLYWKRESLYQIDEIDEIDFNYLVKSDLSENRIYMNIAGDTWRGFWNEYNAIPLEVDLAQGESAILYLEELNQYVSVTNYGADPGLFQFDSTGVGNGPINWSANEDEIVKQWTYDGTTYDILFEGWGSLLATIYKTFNFSFSMAQERDFIKHPTPTAETLFGRELALDGDVLVVGAYDDDYEALSGAGAVFVYRRTGGNNWVFEQELRAPTPTANARFGAAVDISGTRIIVGSFNTQAFIFDYSGGTWTYTATLTPSVTTTGDNFSHNVKIDGDRAICTANSADGIAGNYANCGMVFAYEIVLGSWQEVAALMASNPNNNDYFGTSADLRGDYILVGAYAEDSNSPTLETNNSAAGAGAAYVFRRDAEGVWAQHAYVKAPTPTADANFGYHVGLGDDVLCIIANGGFAAESAQGIFFLELDNDLDQWVHTQRIPFSFSNSAIAFDGSAFAISAFSNISTAPPGEVRIYEKNLDDQWEQVNLFEPSYGATHDRFGFAMDLSGDYIAISAIGDDSATEADPTDKSLSNSGAIYMFGRKQL